MSSNMQYYSVDQNPNRFSENSTENARVFNQPYEQQRLNSHENPRSVNEQRDNYVQSRKYYRDERDQQVHAQPPTNSTNHGWAENIRNQPSSYEAQNFEDQPYQECLPGRQDNASFASYPRETFEKPWSRNTFDNNQLYEQQNIDNRMQHLQINESRYQPSNYYKYKQSHQDNSNYLEYNNKPDYSRNQSQNYQNNSEQHLRPYNDNSDQKNTFARGNDFPSSQQPSNKINTYENQMHLDQTQQAEIVAKTTSDGNEVAVFGVVAKLPPAPTGNPQSRQMQTSEEIYQRPPPPRSPVRTNHLAPISEQPFQQRQDYYSEGRDPGLVEQRTQQYSDDHSRNRYRPVPQKPEPSCTSYDRSYTSEGLDRFRDEYTDSSGYGSTLGSTFTDRSYDASLRHQNRSYPQDSIERRYSNHIPPTDGPPGQQWQSQQEQYSNFPEKGQQLYQRNDWNSFCDDEMNRGYGKAQNSSNGSSLPRDELNRFQDYEQRNFQEYRNSNIHTDERRPLQAVREQTENFDVRGPNVSVPRNSESYESNQYDARPASFGPKFGYNNDHFSSQQQNCSSYPPRPTYSPPQREPQSLEEFHQTTSSQGPPPSQYQPPLQQRYESQKQLTSDLRGHFTPPRQSDPYPPSIHQDRYQPPGRQNPDEDRYDPQYRPSMPYVDPPPQHSQSMNNLDNLQPDKGRLDFQRSGTRNSYSNPHSRTDTSMVVGVRFDRPPSHHSNGYQARLQPIQTAKPFSSNQDVRQSHHTTGPQRVEHFESLQHGQVYYGATARVPPEPSKEERLPSHIQSLSDQSSQRGDIGVQQGSHGSDTSHFNRNHEHRTSDRDSNHVPNVVKLSYEEHNDVKQENKQQQQNRLNLPTQPQHLRHPEQVASQNSQPKHEQAQRAPLKQTQQNEPPVSSDETNYVPSVVAKSYRLLDQTEKREAKPSVDDEWPDLPTGLGQPEQREKSDTAVYGSPGHQSPTARSEKTLPIPDQTPHPQPQSNQLQQQTRQPPTGGDSNRSYPKIPRHPFDPEDEDDSSEGIDVDADTPPPASVQPSWPIQDRRESGKTKASDYGTRNKVIDKSSNTPCHHLRPSPAGEKFQPIRRQPGDGLNDDQCGSSYQQQATPSIAADRETNNPQSLNHDHVKEKSRSEKKENFTRKLRKRSVSSTSESLSDFEITVTSSDLVQQGKPPIIVHQSNLTSGKPAQKCIHSQVHAHKNIHPQNEATQTDIPYTEKKRQESKKFVFKQPSEDAMKRQTAHSLPDVKMPTGQNWNKPTTSSDKGFGDPPKQKTTLDSALQEQFETARENALRKEAKKQQRAPKLAQVFTRMSKSKRSPSPTKQPTRTDDITSVDHNLNVVLKHSKDNADIYQQSKPKYSRERTSERSSSGKHDRGRHDDVRERDRGRSREKPKARESSPGRRERSRERLPSPDRRGRSTSHDRFRSPERKDQRGSRDHSMSPARRAPDRPRDRYRQDREHPNRRVSPPRQRRDECPYPESQLHRREELSHHRSDEPEWVERFRRKRDTEDPESNDWLNDLSKEFDINEYERRVKRATSYNSDFEQPQRKQMLPTKLMGKGGASSKPPSTRRPPPGNDDWMKDLKQHNKVAERNRFGFIGTK